MEVAGSFLDATEEGDGEGRETVGVGSNGVEGSLKMMHDCKTYSFTRKDGSAYCIVCDHKRLSQELAEVKRELAVTDEALVMYCGARTVGVRWKDEARARVAAREAKLRETQHERNGLQDSWQELASTLGMDQHAPVGEVWSRAADLVKELAELRRQAEADRETVRLAMEYHRAWVWFDAGTDREELWNDDPGFGVAYMKANEIAIDAECVLSDHLAAREAATKEKGNG